MEQAILEGDFLAYTDLSNEIQFNGGGHANHEFFWEGLIPIKMYGGVPPPPESELYRLLTDSFGSLDGFIQEFNKRANAIQGSGWCWLIYDPKSDSLTI